MNANCSRRLGRMRMPRALLHRPPLAVDHGERLGGVEALLAQQAADHGAGPADAAPAVQVERLAGAERLVDRVERRAHQRRATARRNPGSRTAMGDTRRPRAPRARAGSGRRARALRAPSVRSMNCRTPASSSASILAMPCRRDAWRPGVRRRAAARGSPSSSWRAAARRRRPACRGHARSMTGSAIAPSRRFSARGSSTGNPASARSSDG